MTSTRLAIAPERSRRYWHPASLDVESKSNPARGVEMRFRHLAIAVALMLPAAFAKAELPDTVKIGILNDMNGPFADQSGKGSVVTAQMAAEDFAEAGGGFKVEILSADHLNKPDVGAQIVRAWVDRDGV